MKKRGHNCDLKSCTLCQNCLPEWLPAVEANRINQSFKKGEIIFGEGELVKGIYFVYSGTVKIHKKWGAEKELIIRFAGPGEIFGHRGLGHEKHYPITATALEPVTACYFGMAFFEATLKVNPDFMNWLLLFFADELQQSERHMRNLAHMQVKGRIAQALLQLEEKFGRDPDGYIGFTLSRQDLASLVGATYETVFRIINELAQDKLISVEGKDISIKDPVRLLSYTRE